MKIKHLWEQFLNCFSIFQSWKEKCIETKLFLEKKLIKQKFERKLYSLKKVFILEETSFFHALFFAISHHNAEKRMKTLA